MFPGLLPRAGARGADHEAGGVLRQGWTLPLLSLRPVSRGSHLFKRHAHVEAEEEGISHLPQNVGADFFLFAVEPSGAKQSCHGVRKCRHFVHFCKLMTEP